MSIKSWGINLSYRVRQIISLLFILVFFSPSHCFTGILPCPRIILLYNIKEKKQSAVEFSYSHPIRQNARQHLLDSFSLQRIFLPGCSDKLRSVTKGFSFLFCRSVHWSKNKNMHGLFFWLTSPLPPSVTYSTLSLFLSCVCFLLQCTSVRSKMLWLLKVRLLHWSTKSKCVFFCLTRAVRLPRQTYNAFTHRQSQKCALDASTPKRLEYRASSFSTLPGKQLCLLYCQIHI